jgi:hypothetical protein
MRRISITMMVHLFFSFLNTNLHEILLIRNIVNKHNHTKTHTHTHTWFRIVFQARSYFKKMVRNFFPSQVWWFKKNIPDHISRWQKYPFMLLYANRKEKQSPHRIPKKQKKIKRKETIDSYSSFQTIKWFLLQSFWLVFFTKENRNVSFLIFIGTFV